MTTKINLLPWRNALREKRKKAFISNLIVAGILGVAAVGAGYMFYSQQLSEQQDVNQMITQENAKLDEQLKALEGLDARRAQIEERMKLIEGLQGQRPVIVRVADELVRLIPQDLYITKFQRTGDKFTIEGKAHDPNVVAELLRGLEMSPWFRNAFMNSYIAGEEKDPNTTTTPAPNDPNNPNQQKSLVERPESKYGTFVITVDLEQPKPVDPATQPAEGATPADTSAPAGSPAQPVPAPAPAQPVPAQPAQPVQAPAQPAPQPAPQQPVPAQPAPQPAPAQPAQPAPAPQPANAPAPAPAEPTPANNSGVAK